MEVLDRGPSWDDEIQTGKIFAQLKRSQMCAPSPAELILEELMLCASIENRSSSKQSAARSGLEGQGDLQTPGTPGRAGQVLNPSRKRLWRSPILGGHNNPLSGMRQLNPGGDAGQSGSRAPHTNNSNRGSSKQPRQTFTKHSNGGHGGPTRGAGEGGDDNEEDEFPIFDDDGDEEDEETEGAATKNDTQCAICDDGGFLLSCDGPCRRSFHVGGFLEENPQNGRPPIFIPHSQKSDDDIRDHENQAACNPLGLEPDMAEAVVLSSNPFQCPNCLVDQHYCFACGELGDAGKDVHRCIVATCGRFYHISCVKGNTNKKGKRQAIEVNKTTLVCPLHRCKLCGKGAEAEEGNGNGELVPCRRCPKAYHRGCIPARLHEWDRVWLADYDTDRNLLPGSRVESSLLYCQKHKVNSDGVAEIGHPLGPPVMINTWKLHCARQHPHVASAQRLIKASGIHITPPSPAKPSKPVGDAAAGGDKHATALVPVRESTPPPPTAADLIAEDVRGLFEAAYGNVHKEMIRRETWQPFPYDKQLKKTVDDRVLVGWEDSIDYARKEYQQTHNASSLATVIDRRAVREMQQRHSDMMVTMAPYLNIDRYTSYGRHFTDRSLLTVVAAKLTHFLRNNDCVVDFSCGANEFLPLVKKMALSEGVVVHSRAYDIVVPQNLSDFFLKSWFDATPDTEGLHESNSLVIGLNPPFGRKCALANMFVAHAANFRPRILVLIVPPETYVPPGYVVVLEDGEVCRGEIFYVPGSAKRSWNKIGPVVRVLERRDLWERSSVQEGGAQWKKIKM